LGMTASLLAIDVGTTRINFGVLDDDGTYRLVQSANGQTVGKRDNQPGNARSGAIKETLVTLSAGAPDASCVERDRHVKLLEGNTWPMS
jgi:hypothetical protein